MKDFIFREYDIRGIVGTDLIIEEVYDLVRAIAYYLKEQDPNVSTIVVGMDGRTHSPAIKDELCRALLDSGLDVMFIGVCPSPVLYYALYTQPVDGGLMITASHNPKEDNGIKICLGKESIWGEQVRVIRDLYKTRKKITPEKKGSYREYALIPDYIEFMARHFPSLIGMKMPIIVDCGNAVGGTVMPGLIKRMGWSNVQLLYPEVDGNYPNHEADPVKEKNMQDVKRLLKTTEAVVGMGLDGDCDRMAAMTKDGYLVPGDELLSVFAESIIKDHANMAVVFDIKSSSGLIELLERWGAKPIFSPSGHAIIKEKMKETHAVLGGELSCHFFFSDRFFGFDDGIYSLMRLLELLVQSGKSLRYFVDRFPKKESSPEYRISYDERLRTEIIAVIKRAFSLRKDIDMITIDGIRATMPYGWGIIRPSNTQPVMCLRFESDTRDGLEKVKRDFMDVLAPYFDKQEIKTVLSE
jgi:phosphomannomutase/phosphoglucomutase